MHNEKKEEVICKVTRKSESKQTAVFIAKTVSIGKQLSLRFIGAGACNQAVKAVIEANKILAGEGRRLALIPSFIDIPDEDKEHITGIKLAIKEIS